VQNTNTKRENVGCDVKGVRE